VEEGLGNAAQACRAVLEQNLQHVYELLTELDLNNVAALGHSMGSSVIWCYIDLFGPERKRAAYWGLVDLSFFVRQWILKSRRPESRLT
jgi:pimeloyl-ACP methyl ester carboxylesterase